MASADRSWTPHISGRSRMTFSHPGSCHIAAAASCMTSRTLLMSLRYGTGKSTTARAQPCDSLPDCVIVPFRICQTTPLTSRTWVILRLTASTVPVILPISATSPTPYWSSSIMKMPARKSWTTFCAPNPIATPSTPARAREHGREVEPQIAQDHHERDGRDRDGGRVAQDGRNCGRALLAPLAKQHPATLRPAVGASAGAGDKPVDQPVGGEAQHERDQQDPPDPQHEVRGTGEIHPVSSAALALCEMSRASRQAIPGPDPHDRISDSPASASGLPLRALRESRRRPLAASLSRRPPGLVP